MPSALTYPGVYVEEISSGVRTIVGVSTSVTAFVGRTERGPVNQATTVTSLADFQRTFGGTGPAAPVAYAVRDFFLNGGTKAVIVRLFFKDEPRVASAAKNGSLTLRASGPGEWGDDLLYRCDQTDPLQEGSFFNLSILRTNPANTAEPVLLERFTALSADKKSGRRADRVLDGSDYVRGALDDTPVAPTGNHAFTTKAEPNTPLADGRYRASRDKKEGLYALEQTDIFNLLCVPPDTFTGDTSAAVYRDAASYCAERRAFLLLDPPTAWHNTDRGTMAPPFKNDPRAGKNGFGINGTLGQYAAVFFPRVVQPDHTGAEAVFAPCGLVAGLFAKTDTARGVWKAPAGIEAGILGVRRLAVNMTDDENGILNPVGINCLRSFAASGNVVWGSRTLRGDDQTPDDYKYVPVRRLALFLEESLYRGTQWAVFEPNDEPLWAQLRMAVGDFLNDLYRKGAFAGATASAAYKVFCDATTTTQGDVNRGVVNVLVQFAPLKPAEFVVLKIQQLAGQVAAG